MSTVKVAAVNHPDATSGGLAFAADGRVTGSGLDLITAQSFTAVSTVSVNNCFSSTYQNYVIQLELTGSTTATVVAFRNRLAGVDASTNYTWSRTDLGTTASGTTGGAVTSGDLCVVVSTGPIPCVWNHYSPALAKATTFTTLSSRLDSNRTNVTSGIHSTATAYDGFTIFPSTGTFTGTVRVYGYRN